MSSLSATQSDGYYLPSEYFESGAYKKVSRNRYAAESEAKAGGKKPPTKVGHNQWLKHGVIRFELPEKAVCLGCRQSVGRGTRFNARKVKTDQSYFTTPIFEFRLTCRNCQHPWVIRTDPKERGFEYVSGVKRQAGQDRNLVDASLGSSVDVTSASGSSHTHRNSLERLEVAAVVKKTTGKSMPLTEIEELDALRKLNEKASAEGKDVDHNAFIRKIFRTDRRAKRKRLLGASGLGWRKGMALLPSSNGDVLAAKETCYGRASAQEHQKLSSVRKSSIFESSSSRSNRGKPGKRRRMRDGSFRSSVPEIVASAVAPDRVPSERTAANLKDPSPMPEKIASMASPPAASSKTTLKLCNGTISIVGSSEAETTNGKAVVCGKEADSHSKSVEDSRNYDSKTLATSSFLDLVGGYGSSDED